MVIEIVDAREKIDRFLDVLEPMMQGGLITLENVEVRLGRTKTANETADKRR